MSENTMMGAFCISAMINIKMNMENNFVVRKHISLLIWGIGYSISIAVLLLFFSWKWATIAFLWILLISPLISVFFYSFLKPFIDRRIFHLRDFVSGAIEALVLLVLDKLNPPNFFLLAVIVLYLINQITRSIRLGSFGLANEEFRELIGFIGVLPVIFLLRAII